MSKTGFKSQKTAGRRARLNVPHRGSPPPSEPVRIWVRRDGLATIRTEAEPLRDWIADHERLATGAVVSTGDRLQIQSAALPIAVRMLTEHGIRHRIVGRRPPQPEAQTSAMLGCRPERRRFLLAVSEADRGIIESPGPDDRPDLCAARIIPMFPGKRIIIVTPSRISAISMRNSLGALNFRVKLSRVNGGPVKRRRIEVGTADCLSSITGRRQAVLIVVDADWLVRPHHARACHIEQAVWGANSFGRAYGVVTKPLTNSAADQTVRLRLQALYGPTLFHDCQDSIGSAVFVPYGPQGNPRRECRLDGLAYKRQAIWHNQPRNRFIARLAQALVNRDDAELQKLGITSNEARRSLAKMRRVTVLVESTEHVRAIRSLLRDWPVQDAVPDELVKPRRPSALARAGGNHGIIVTQMSAALYGIRRGIIVRATGGDDDLLIDGWTTGSLDAHPSPYMVVDVNDQDTERSWRETQRRECDYRAHWIQIVVRALDPWEGTM